MQNGFSINGAQKVNKTDRESVGLSFTPSIVFEEFFTLDLTILLKYELCLLNIVSISKLFLVNFAFNKSMIFDVFTKMIT